MTRTTLLDRISDIRRMTGAGDSVYSVGDVQFFADDHIQDYLDRNRCDLTDHELTPAPVNVQGTSLYLDYYVGTGNLEATDGGTAAFVVRDADGTAVGTALYSVDYVRGVVTFTTNQAGSAYAVTARGFDLYGAAADLLDDWAAHEALSFDFQTDNQQFKRSQKADMLSKRAAEYRAKQPVRSVHSRRGDLSGVDDEQPGYYRQIRVV